MSALFKQDRVLGDAKVKILPNPNVGEPTRLYRSLVALMIGLSALSFLEIGTANSHDPKRPELNAWFKKSNE